jgi:predicted transcriptional regulator
MAESSPPDRISITIEITPEQKRRLERLAEQRRLSPAAVVRAALDRELKAASSEIEDDQNADIRPGSFLDGIEHLVGSVEGPSDLSTNPEHMEGYGRS